MVGEIGVFAPGQQRDAPPSYPPDRFANVLELTESKAK